MGELPHVVRFNGNWGRNSAGGSFNEPIAAVNPHYQLNVSKPTQVEVTLTQGLNPRVPIGVHIFNNGGFRVGLFPLSADHIVASSGEYRSDATVSCVVELVPNERHYVIFVSTFNPYCYGPFSITIASNSPVTVNPFEDPVLATVPTPPPKILDSESMKSFQLSASADEESGSQDFIDEILHRMYVEHYKAKDLIVKKGDVGDRMFFIARGTVEIVLPTGKNPTIGAGTYFGEIAMFLADERQASVRAQTDVDVMVLTKIVCDKVLWRYPRALEQFRQMATKRMQDNATMDENSKRALVPKWMGKLSQMTSSMLRRRDTLSPNTDSTPAGAAFTFAEGEDGERRGSSSVNNESERQGTRQHLSYDQALGLYKLIQRDCSLPTDTNSLSPEPTVDYSALEASLLARDGALVRALNAIVLVNADMETLVGPLLRTFDGAGKVHQLIKLLIKEEVRHTPHDAPTTCFRGNTIASKVLTSYCKAMGTDYLQAILAPGIAHLKENPEKLKVDLPEDDPKLAGNVEHMVAVCTTFIDTIVVSANDCPRDIRAVCAILKNSTLEKFPGHAKVLIGGLIFLRYICPALLAPDVTDMGTGAKAAATRVALVNVSKTLQRVANGVLYNKNQPNMRGLNSFMSAKMPELANFLLQLADDETSFSRNLDEDYVCTTARGIYNFVPRAPAEIALVEGQLVRDVQRTEHSGWQFGRIGDASGYFPSFFTVECDDPGLPRQVSVSHLTNPLVLGKDLPTHQQDLANIWLAVERVVPAIVKRLCARSKVITNAEAKLCAADQPKKKAHDALVKEIKQSVPEMDATKPTGGAAAASEPIAIPSEPTSAPPSASVSMPASATASKEGSPVLSSVPPSLPPVPSALPPPVPSRLDDSLSMSRQGSESSSAAMSRQTSEALMANNPFRRRPQSMIITGSLPLAVDDERPPPALSEEEAAALEAEKKSVKAAIRAATMAGEPDESIQPLYDRYLELKALLPERLQKQKSTMLLPLPQPTFETSMTSPGGTPIISPRGAEGTESASAADTTPLDGQPTSPLKFPGQRTSTPTKRMSVTVDTGERPFTVWMFVNGNKKIDGLSILISVKKYRTFDNFKTYLSTRIPLATGAVRKVCSLTGKLITDFAQFEEGGNYVACGGESFKAIEYKAIR